MIQSGLSTKSAIWRFHFELNRRGSVISLVSILGRQEAMVEQNS